MEYPRVFILTAMMSAKTNVKLTVNLSDIMSSEYKKY